MKVASDRPSFTIEPPPIQHRITDLCSYDRNSRRLQGDGIPAVELLE